jgi:hypothetical protein
MYIFKLQALVQIEKATGLFMVNCDICLTHLTFPALNHILLWRCKCQRQRENISLFFLPYWLDLLGATIKLLIGYLYFTNVKGRINRHQAVVIHAIHQFGRFL